MEQKNKVKEQIFAYLMLIVGSFLFAVGDVMFVNPYLLAPGGTYGLSNVLNTVWPWKISYYAICMDIPLLLIGTWILGPKFGFKTIDFRIHLGNGNLLGLQPRHPRRHHGNRQHAQYGADSAQRAVLHARLLP